MISYTTVRSGAEERLAWNTQEHASLTKNMMCLWDFGWLPSAMYVVKNVVRTQPEDKNI